MRTRCLFFLLSVATLQAALGQSAGVAAPASNAAAIRPTSAATAASGSTASQALPAGSAASAASVNGARSAPPSGQTDSSKKEPPSDCCNDARLHHQLVVGAGVVAGLLAIFSMGLTVFATWQASRGAQGIHFRSYWGGFGGSGSGWELTPPAVSLIAATLLASTSAVIFVSLLKLTDPKPVAGSEIRSSTTATATKS